MKLSIPNYKDLDIKKVVFDYNGTLASGGSVADEVRILLGKLCEAFEVYVITADTFGTVRAELESFDLEVVVLKGDDHTAEKAAFLESLGADCTTALGNGNNDRQMLQAAQLSIAVIGSEGCSVETMMVADIVVTDIRDAMKLLLEPDRLKATLRR